MTKPRPAAVRFFTRVQKTDTCWLWTGGRSRGYGMFFPAPGANLVGAHRWSYEYHVGTQAVNNARKPVPSHCPSGHLMDAANTYAARPGRGRSCRECNRLYVRAKRAEKRAAA